MSGELRVRRVRGSKFSLREDNGGRALLAVDERFSLRAALGEYLSTAEKACQQSCSSLPQSRTLIQQVEKTPCSLFAQCISGITAFATCTLKISFTHNRFPSLQWGKIVGCTKLETIR